MTPFQSFLKTVPPEKKQVFIKLNKLIEEKAPNLKPYLEGTFMAYGEYHYKYESGREGTWFTVGLRNNKNSIAVYVTTIIGDTYLAENYKKKLQASIGRSCIRFKKETDLDYQVLGEIFEKANNNYQVTS